MKPGDLRMASIHKGFHQKDIIALGRFDDLQGLSMVERDRFFTENVFTGVGSFDGPLRMQRVWNGDIYGLHIGVCQQLFIATITTWDMPGVSKASGILLSTTANREQVACLRLW